MNYRIVCTKCGHEEDQRAFRCGLCNSILEVKFDYDSFRLKADFKSERIRTKKYLDFFPIDRLKVGGDEGNAPLVSKRYAGDIRLKIETKNPTHSFKDRGSVVEINKAIELGVDRVCCASTGNMGISVSRYAKLAGICATIFLSVDADPHKERMIKRYGANIVKVKGDFNKSMRMAERFAIKNDAFVCGDYHYRKEGQKSVAFEIIEQSGYRVPDFIFLPVGNATLLSAIYKGLSEFRRFGLIDRLPRLVAVQSNKCAPLVRAYASGKRITYVKPRTIADAIAVGYPTFGFEGIKALRGTSGMGIEVSEDEICNAVNILAELKIKSETGGATGFAGLERLRLVNPKTLWKSRPVIIITGSN